MTPWRISASGVDLFVVLTPKSSRDEVGGIVETTAGIALKAKVRALPAKGSANTALIKLVAKWLGVPKTSISLSSGSRSRVKTLAISGESAFIENKLKTLVASG